MFNLIWKVSQDDTKTQDVFNHVQNYLVITLVGAIGGYKIRLAMDHAASGLELSWNLAVGYLLWVCALGLFILNFQNFMHRLSRSTISLFLKLWFYVAYTATAVELVLYTYGQAGGG